MDLVSIFGIDILGCLQEFFADLFGTFLSWLSDVTGIDLGQE